MLRCSPAVLRDTAARPHLRATRERRRLLGGKPLGGGRGQVRIVRMRGRAEFGAFSAGRPGWLRPRCRTAVVRWKRAGERSPRPPRSPIRVAAPPPCRGWAGATRWACCRRRAALKTAPAARPAAARGSLPSGLPAGRSRRAPEGEVGSGVCVRVGAAPCLSCCPRLVELRYRSRLFIPAVCLFWFGSPK